MEIRPIRSGKDYGKGLLVDSGWTGVTQFSFQGPAGTPSIYIIFKDDKFIDYSSTEEEARRKVYQHAESNARSRLQKSKGEREVVFSVSLEDFLKNSSH
ncbi:MAG: hypothetical protein AABX66_03880 [Nanoarchaeota archaeon]